MYSECTVLEDNTITNSAVSDLTIFNQTVKNNMPYIKEICLRNCQIHLEATCINYVPMSFKCTRNATSRANTTTTVNMKSYCYAQCPLECSSTVYSHIVSYYQYSQDYFDQYSNVTGRLNGSLVDNLVEVFITYDSAAYNLYANEPKMSELDLAATIGGHLHVFLGMSLMSIVEVLELMLVILASLLRKVAKVISIKLGFCLSNTFFNRLYKLFRL
jgi:hypothetical protein